MSILYREARTLSFVDAKEMISEQAYNFDIKMPAIRSWLQLEHFINEHLEPAINSARQTKRSERKVKRDQFMQSLTVGEEFKLSCGDVVHVVNIGKNIIRVEYVYAVDEFQTMQCGDRCSMTASQLMTAERNEHEPLMLPNTKGGARSLSTGARSCERVTDIQIIAKEWFDSYYGNSYNSVRFDVYVSGALGDRMIEIVLPFTYGYGDYYLQRVREYMARYFGFNNNDTMQLITSDNMVRGLRKREVKAWGEL